MTQQKQIVEETQEVCTLCGGRGRETRDDLPATTGGVPIETCRLCSGAGFVTTKRVVRYESHPAAPEGQ